MKEPPDSNPKELIAFTKPYTLSSAPIFLLGTKGKSKYKAMRIYYES
jgi:hypothetical protein